MLFRSIPPSMTNAWISLKVEGQAVSITWPGIKHRCMMSVFVMAEWRTTAESLEVKPDFPTELPSQQPFTLNYETQQPPIPTPPLHSETQSSPKPAIPSYKSHLYISKAAPAPAYMTAFLQQSQVIHQRQQPVVVEA